MRGRRPGDVQPRNLLLHGGSADGGVRGRGQLAVGPATAKRRKGKRRTDVGGRSSVSAEGCRRSEAVHPAGEEVVRAREGLPKMVASNITSSSGRRPIPPRHASAHASPDPIAVRPAYVRTLNWPLCHVVLDRRRQLGQRRLSAAAGRVCPCSPSADDCAQPPPNMTPCLSPPASPALTLLCPPPARPTSIAFSSHVHHKYC